MAIRKSLALFITLASIFFQTQASAQSRGRGEDRQGSSRAIEARLAALEDQVYELRRRVERCEGSNSGGSSRPSGVAACVLMDSNNGKAYFGQGRVSVEAEQIAREACAKENHASYCNTAVRCTDARESRPSVCILRDTNRGKSYKGDGQSAGEAEYKARRACSSENHASYCEKAVTCQSY